MQRLWILACLVPLALSFDTVLDDDACGGNITVSKKDLSFPNGSNTTCTWHFMSNKTRRYFTFATLDLAPGDYFVVYDNDHSAVAINGSDIVTGNFTGKLDPFIAVTFSNISTLVYHRAAGQTKASNFTIHFNTNKCEVSVQEAGGIVRSPVFHPASQGTLNCSYHVKTNDANGTVALTFDAVNMTKGGVTVWNGDPKTGDPLLDATGPVKNLGDVLSSGRALLLETVLPTSRVDNFTAIFYTANHACRSGMITLDKPMNRLSPGYPNNYVSNLDCRYVITSPKNTTVAIEVLDVDLGDSIDEVTITDGDNKLAKVLAPINAGFKQKGFLLTSGNKLWVRMRTDESRTGRGFHIRLTPKVYGGAGFGQGRIAIRPKINTTQLAELQDDTNNTDTNVYFVLYANKGMQVSLTLNESVWAPTASVEFRDGSNINDSLIGYFGSQGNPSYTVVSSGEVMLVVARGFLETPTQALRLFVADFVSVPPGTQTSYSGDSGSVTLRESAINESATYIILNQDPKSMVSLEIQELYVPPNASVVIYQGPSDLSLRFINYTTGPGENPVKAVPVIYTKQARIEYRLTSKPTVDAERVLLRFSYRLITGCDRYNISKSSGALESPLYPNLYPANAICKSTFIPVHNKSLRLSFSDISLAANHSLSIEADHYRVVKVGNKTTVNVTSETLDVLSRDQKDIPDVIIPMHVEGLNTTVVKVTFNSSFMGNSADLQSSSGFKINYEHLACGGNITDPSQIMSTPGFPAAVSGGPVRCVWVINFPPRPASSNTSVNIISYKLNIQHYKPNTNTTNTTLEMHDGGSNRGAVIPLTMKDGESREMLSRTNKMWVLYSFNSTDKTKKEGFAFSIKFSVHACGGNITDPSQIMSTPGFPAAVSGGPVRCVWVINLPPRPASSNTSVNIISYKLNIQHYKPNTNTTNTTLEMHDGGSNRGAVIPLTMKDGESGEMLSRTNKMWVLYSFNSTDKTKKEGFAFSIKFSVHVCAKKDQCDNGVCMHSDWRCNGRDECGDDSDERNCYHATNTVSRVVLGMSILVTFIVATALACVVPALYKRFKYPHYSELRDLMTPVPT